MGISGRQRDLAATAVKVGAEGQEGTQQELTQRVNAALATSEYLSNDGARPLRSITLLVGWAKSAYGCEN